MVPEKDAAIARLTEEVSYLRKKLFGSSSEKRPDIDPNQLSLFDMDGMEDIPVVDVEETDSTVVKEPRSRKKKPTLDEQFAGTTI